MTAKGRIIISGIGVFAHHGCTPAERERGQNFFIDIELVYDCSAAVAGDDLASAVDYNRVACAVRDLAQGERYDLIETLAARIGGHIMETTGALSALVRVHKPEAPLDCEVHEVALEMAFGADA